MATFEPDGYAREPAGGEYIHRGLGGLRAFYEPLFSNDGGIPLEHCAVVDNGRACALEYNVVRWGKTELPPQGASLSTFAVGAADSLPPASTTTPSRRSAHVCNASAPARQRPPRP